jgi:hypothetical protein
MPPVIDTRNEDRVEAHTLESEQSQARGFRPGCWRSLAHALTTHLTPMPRERHAPLHSTSRPCEAPMDRLVREYASLSLLALAII